MARGKQAAKSANRRAQAAQAKTGEVKERLTKEREEKDAHIKELREEINRLKNSHRTEAERLAAEEVARLREEMLELTRQRSAAAELVRQAAKSKEYLVFNACRYISMTQGIGPGEAFTLVATWITGENFNGVRDAESFLTENMLPSDGWLAQNMRRDAHWDHIISKSKMMATPSAMSLDAAEEQGNESIHPDYRAIWYEKRPTSTRVTARRSVNVIPQARMVLRKP